MKGNSVKGGLADKDPAIGLFTHMNNHLRFFFGTWGGTGSSGGARGAGELELRGTRKGLK